MVAIKIRNTKYIFVFDGNYKQFVYRTTYRCVARNMLPASYGLRDHPQTIVLVTVVAASYGFRDHPQTIVLVTVVGNVVPYFITAFVLLRRLV